MKNVSRGTKNEEEIALTSSRDGQRGDAHPALPRNGRVPNMSDGIALEEIQCSTQKANNAKRDNAGVEDNAMPCLYGDTQ